MNQTQYETILGIYTSVSEEETIALSQQTLDDIDTIVGMVETFVMDTTYLTDLITYLLANNQENLISVEQEALEFPQFVVTTVKEVDFPEVFANNLGELDYLNGLLMDFFSDYVRAATNSEIAVVNVVTSGVVQSEETVLNVSIRRYSEVN